MSNFFTGRDLSNLISYNESWNPCDFNDVSIDKNAEVNFLSKKSFYASIFSDYCEVLYDQSFRKGLIRVSMGGPGHSDTCLNVYRFFYYTPLGTVKKKYQ